MVVSFCSNRLPSSSESLLISARQVESIHCWSLFFRRVGGAMRVTPRAPQAGFIVLLARVRSDDEIREIRDRIARVLDQPHTIRGAQVSVPASIGASLMTAAGDRLSDLLHDADSNMYAVKRERRRRPAKTNNC